MEFVDVILPFRSDFSPKALQRYKDQAIPEIGYRLIYLNIAVKIGPDSNIDDLLLQFREERSQNIDSIASLRSDPRVIYSEIGP